MRGENRFSEEPLILFTKSSLKLLITLADFQRISKQDYHPVYHTLLSPLVGRRNDMRHDSSQFIYFPRDNIDRV